MQSLNKACKLADSHGGLSHTTLYAIVALLKR